MLGILPGAIIAVILGAAALVQTTLRRDRGRLLAIAAIMLGVGWSIAYVWVGVSIANHHPRTLQVGDCTADIPARAHTTDVAAVPCDKPHRGEVIGTVEVDGFGDYPGDDELWVTTSLRCDDVERTILEAELPQLPLSAKPVLTPTAEQWAAGDHTVTCLFLYDRDVSGRQVR